MKLMSIPELEAAVNGSQGVEKILFLTRLGRSQVGSDVTRAEDLANEALNLSKDFEDAVAYSLILNLKSDCKFVHGLFNEGLNLAEQALELQQIIDDPELLVRSYSQIANNSLRLSSFETSLLYYNKALKIYTKQGSDSGIAMVYGNISLIHQQRGEFEEALKYLGKSQRINKQIGNKREIARNLANKGAIFHSQGYLTKSVKSHLKSLEIKEALNDKEGMAHSLGSIGITLSQQQQNSAALEYLNRALSISREVGNGYYISHYLVDIATVYSQQGKLKKSLEYNLEALELSRAGGMRSNEIHTLSQIAELNLHGKDYEASIQSGKQALALAVKYEDFSQLPIIQHTIAEGYFHIEDYTNATKFATEALSQANSIDLKPQMAQAHSLLSRIAKEKKNWKEALLQHEQYIKIQSEFLEEQQNEKLDQVRTKYEAEKAMRETELYRLKNVKLAKKNKKISEQQAALTLSEHKYRSIAEKLAESNSMKDLLLDIITHDLKNPAGVIFSMSQMVYEDYPGMDEIDVIRSSSERLLQVLENANSLSKVSSDEAINKDDLHLKTIIQSVITDFSSQLRLNHMTTGINIPDDLQIQANPLIREVLDNYLSNAIKYASEGGHVDFIARVESGEVIICVNDLGAVIAEKDRELVFKRTTQLTDGIKRGRGLGLAIVKKIARAHGGKCWVEANQPNGNSFRISLPVK